MAQEAADAPNVVEKQLLKNASICAELGERIRQLKPRLVYIIGRGSSDHAGVYAKYLVEVELGIPVTASAPSVTSVYGKNLDLSGALVLVISQSGRSPDILGQTQMAKDSGAFCVALVNDQSSPLADIVDVVLPLLAGEEKAVAATKSFLATLSAILQLVAHWKQSQPLITALTSLPNCLRLAAAAETQLTTDSIRDLSHCVVLGRGFGYAIAREIALKLKEVCGVHAEAFSSAEFLHGPVTLVEKKLAIVDISVQDESLETHTKQIEEMHRRGAKLSHMSQIPNDIHPRLAPLTILQRFYLDVENIAVQMGNDPDNPVGLKKVTKTV
jgi:glucosamine--fructose-6-phosphate aminotransferase (isomerizing)